MKALFDTNILINYLGGFEAAKNELNLYRTRLVSVITQIEVLIGVENEEEEWAVRLFLSTFEVRGLTVEITEEAVNIRKETRMKVPDAIVYASTREEGCLILFKKYERL